MYKIFYIDETKFQGGSLEDSKWLESPNLPILAIECIFPSINNIKLQGFEAYNFLHENIQLIGSKQKLITKYYIMAKKDERVYIIGWDFQSKQLIREVKPWKKEGLRGSVTTGWKEGLKHQTPLIKLCKDKD